MPGLGCSRALQGARLLLGAAFVLSVAACTFNVVLDPSFKQLHAAGPSSTTGSQHLVPEGYITGLHLYDFKLSSMRVKDRVSRLGRLGKPHVHLLTVSPHFNASFVSKLLNGTSSTRLALNQRGLPALTTHVQTASLPCLYCLALSWLSSLSSSLVSATLLHTLSELTLLAGNTSASHPTNISHHTPKPTHSTLLRGHSKPGRYPMLVFGLLLEVVGPRQASGSTQDSQLALLLLTPSPTTSANTMSACSSLALGASPTLGLLAWLQPLRIEPPTSGSPLPSQGPHSSAQAMLRLLSRPHGVLCSRSKLDSGWWADRRSSGSRSSAKHSSNDSSSITSTSRSNGSRDGPHLIRSGRRQLASGTSELSPELESPGLEVGRGASCDPITQLQQSGQPGQQECVCKPGGRQTPEIVWCHKYSEQARKSARLDGQVRRWADFVGRGAMAGGH
ncbi:hypothetical protein V8C86DRAFT_2752280 [Haematococcus lacustris]